MGAQRKAQFEHAALADFALHRNAAAMPLGHGLHDDQPEADAGGLVAPLTDNPAEALEKPWQCVRRHPLTGRPTLYSVSGSAFGVEGMDDREGLELLRELTAHATQPKYLHRPSYAEGDVVIWDNCCLLHSAPLTDPTQPRTLWRITVKDAGPTC